MNRREFNKGLVLLLPAIAVFNFADNNFYKAIDIFDKETKRTTDESAVRNWQKIPDNISYNRFNFHPFYGYKQHPDVWKYFRECLENLNRKNSNVYLKEIYELKGIEGLYNDALMLNVIVF
jgi:hypothetical protein